jgi:hypothetical protein
MLGAVQEDVLHLGGAHGTLLINPPVRHIPGAVQKDILPLGTSHGILGCLITRPGLSIPQ